MDVSETDFLGCLNLVCDFLQIAKCYLLDWYEGGIQFELQLQKKPTGPTPGHA